MSAINYSEKGERNHLTFLESFAEYKDHDIHLPEIEEVYEELSEKDKLGGGEQDWRGLLEVLKEYEVTGWLVCESPNLEHDALLMQKYYQSL
jgi:deoxyribonuclease-4